MRTVHFHHALMSAALVLAAEPALANTFPGTLCTSTGTTNRSLTGLMVNTVTGPGTTQFLCPIAHARYGGDTSTPLTIRVNYKTSNYAPSDGSVKFQCSIRTVLSNNQTVDTLTLTGFPTASVGAYDSVEGKISLPVYGSINMRCEVPNVFAGGGEAGIVSYSAY